MEELNPKIPKSEVKRQLGYSEETVSNPKIEELITAAIVEAEEIIKPRGNYLRLEEITIEDDRLNLGTQDLIFQSQDIAKLLANQEQVVILAVTLGPKLEEQVDDLFTADEFTKATILDAVGSIAVEEAANELQKKIATEAKELGLPSLTMRYSPGYGDLGLEIQEDLLSLLQGQKLGIETNESFLLIPQKSITALIGLGEEESTAQPKCDFDCKNCEYDSCIYQ
ncbi:MAG: hypothetical protein R6V17_08665 [Halanaerobacter sp.]